MDGRTKHCLLSAAQSENRQDLVDELHDSDARGT